MAKRLTYNLSEAAEALGIRRSHLHSLISNGETGLVEDWEPTLGHEGSCW